MATLKRILLFTCLAALLVGMMLLSGCETPNDTTAPTKKPIVQNTAYTVTVRTAGGVQLEDITVYVRKSAEDRDLVDMPKKLDSEGKYVFVAPTSNEYVVELEGVPAGYDVQAQYQITSAETEIVLTSAPIAGEVPAGTTYNVGDIIHDYSFTDINGVQHTISDILKEKNALVLNFWYVNCSFCIKEFPSLQEAYEMYSDRVEVLALNTEDDSEKSIKDLMDKMGLTFPAAKGGKSLLMAMKSTGCPTTVVIDRYGMISFVYSGDLSKEPAAFRALLRHFSEEEFTQCIVESEIEALDALIREEDIPYGCEKYPYPVGAVEEFVGHVKAGEPVYYNLYKASNITVRIEDPDVYLIYNGETYEPVNGVIELVLVSEGRGVTVQLGTKGGVDKEVVIKQLSKQGSSENPYQIELGNQNITFGADGTYFYFNAQHTGTFTLTLDQLPAGVVLGANMTNLRTSVAVDAISTDCTDPVTGAVTFTIAVEAGDTVRIILTASGEITDKITVQALASIPEVGGIGGYEDPYTVTVRDENGLPMPGVTVSVLVGGEQVPAITNEEGVAILELKAGTYSLTLTVPEGYYASRDYLLTPANRTLQIDLEPSQEYTVQVSVSGSPLTEAANVKIYADSGKSVLLYSGVLDENGEFRFTHGYIDGCVAVLEGLPSSVFVQTSYPLTGALTQIALVRTSIGDTNASNQNYQLGDQINDFSVTTPDGRVYTLYELLTEKKAVVLTFWHTSNAPSIVAFQYLEVAYQKYGQQVEILAMNPLDKSDADIETFQAQNDLSFPMAQCSSQWESALHLTLYPTMVVIDRNGTICLIHSGAVTDANALDAVMTHYTAEDYQTTVVDNIQQLLPQTGPDGSQENPYIVPRGTTRLTVKLNAGQSACYIIQEQEPMSIRIESADAYIIYQGQTYTAVDGVVQVDINIGEAAEPEVLIIGNAGDAQVIWEAVLTVLAAG